MDHLDLQVERNKIKPYTYTDDKDFTSYSHNLQSLTHPLGANLEENLLLVRYAPSRRWLFDGRVISTAQGEDANGLDYGGNILLGSTNRVMNYGNYTLQGVRSDILLVGLDVSYSLYHNVFLDGHLLYRDKVSEDVTRNLKTFYLGVGVRVNVGQSRYDY